MAVVLSGCNSTVLYDKYQHTQIAGWEKNDTLSFSIPSLKEGGRYSESICLRINASYPFTSLTLITEQTVYPSKEMKRDTVNCELFDKNGKVRGKGLNYYQYDFPYTQIKLSKGDSIHIIIKHNMKREILPGVSEVGFKLTTD